MNSDKYYAVSHPSNAGYKTVIAGILIQMFTGCFFLWANISVYVLSYIYKFDKHVNQNGIFYVDVALVLLMVFGYQIGTYLLNQKRWSPKTIILLGACIALSGIYMSSYAHSLNQFITLYGVFCGIGSGIMYMIPLVCSWEHFPNHRGLVTGIIIGSVGLGSFFFTQLSTWIVNPHNEQATIFINYDLSYFEETVADRVPYMFQLLVYIWGCQLGLAIILISRPSSQPEKNSQSLLEKKEEYNLTSAFACLHSTRFW